MPEATPTQCSASQHSANCASNASTSRPRMNALAARVRSKAACSSTAMPACWRERSTNGTPAVLVITVTSNERMPNAQACARSPSGATDATRSSGVQDMTRRASKGFHMALVRIAASPAPPAPGHAPRCPPAEGGRARLGRRRGQATGQTGRVVVHARRSRPPHERVVDRAARPDPRLGGRLEGRLHDGGVPVCAGTWNCGHRRRRVPRVLHAAGRARRRCGWEGRGVRTPSRQPARAAREPRRQRRRRSGRAHRQGARRDGGHTVLLPRRDRRERERSGPRPRGRARRPRGLRRGATTSSSSTTCSTRGVCAR